MPLKSLELIDSLLLTLEKNMTSSNTNIFNDEDLKNVNRMRCIAAKAVEQANSGHPGAPIGLAPLAYVLWSQFMNGSVGNNNSWTNRDRFVLSNGHACMLQYMMLHLCTYNVSLNDLNNFRQLNSITPGHPERGITDGVEVTTGPLGQGIAQGVGLAMGSKYFGSIFNNKDYPNLVSNFIYVLCGDGCLEEGVSGEASSLAGHLQLNNLIIIWDNNKITIDGHTDLSFSENVLERYRSYGFNTFEIKNGNSDLNDIYDVILNAKNTSIKNNKPSFISLSTIIGYGTNKQDTHGVHGSPLGKDSLSLFLQQNGFDKDISLKELLSKELYDYFRNTFIKRSQSAEKQWNELFKSYCNNKSYTKESSYFQRLLKGSLPTNWQSEFLLQVEEYRKSSKSENATRNINGDMLRILANIIPEILGGSADLTPSNKTQLKNSGDFSSSNYKGRYFRFGVREHGMFSIVNGMASYGNLIPFSATFLNFITYGWGAVRLTALSHLRQIFIMTHDSIFLGEDGPTHQPIEVLPLLRSTPNLYTFRPCDINEIAGSWILTLNKLNKSPSCYCLTRQKVPTNLKGTSINKIKYGAYIIQENDNNKKNGIITFIASGSEVPTCVNAVNTEIFQKNNNRAIRIISAPCLDLLKEQNYEYLQSLFGGNNNIVISVEAQSTNCWARYSHYQFGVDTFGKSGPLKSVRKDFGFEPQQVAEKALKVLKVMGNRQAPTLPCLLPQI